MKKIIMIVFLVMNTVSIGYSYDLSTLDGLKQCKADSNCYACEANGAVSQCVKLSPYDNELGEINSNKYDWVCNVSSKKEMCKEKIDNDIMEEKKITISNIATGAEIFGSERNYQLAMLSGENAGKGVIYTLNNTILKVNFDMSFLKGEVVTIDFTNKIKQNSDIKKYEEENWRVKDIKIIHKYNKKWCPYIYNNENGGIVTDKKECNETIPVNNTPASTYRFGYIKNNTSIKTNVCVDYIDVIDDIYNEYRACVVGLIAEVILERPKKIITCPSDNNKNCYKDGNNYFCSLSECSSGSGIQLETNDPNMSPDDLVDTSKNTNKEKQICSVDSVTIAEGTFGSCRRPSTLVDKDLTNDCCEMTIDNRDAQDAIVTGIADVISVLGGTYTLISDLLKEIGLADFDFINQLLVDVINMMRGGRCTDSEMMIATSAASTRGLVVKDSGGEIVYKDKNDGGNCVYLGEYCTNYAGHCDKGSFLGIKWENPIGWGCERPAKAFCCYSDIFEKALAKAARDQMPNKYNWGSINGDVVSPTRLYSPGKNPCKPDKDKLNVNCDGVALSDLVNINFDSEQFQEDMKAYTGILLNDITKPGGAIDMANEELRNNIKNLNPADILQDTLNSIGAIK